MLRIYWGEYMHIVIYDILANMSLCRHPEKLDDLADEEDEDENASVSQPQPPPPMPQIPERFAKPHQ